MKKTDSGSLSDSPAELGAGQKREVSAQLHKPNRATAITQKISGLTEHNPDHTELVQKHIDDLQAQGRVKAVQGGNGGYQLHASGQSES